MLSALSMDSSPTANILMSPMVVMINPEHLVYLVTCHLEMYKLGRLEIESIDR